MPLDLERLKARYLKLREHHPEVSSNAAMASRLGVSPSTLRKYRAVWDVPAAPEREKPAVEPPREEPAAPAPPLEPRQVRKAREPKPPTEPRPPREKRFSEAHPGAWNLARNLLPRLQVLVPMLILCYSALTETMKGNYAFYNDWADALKLPQIIRVASDLDLLQEALMADGGYYLMIVIAAVLGLVLFYEFVWKSAFKEYRKKVYMREYREGRCYWHEGNWWHRAWDKHYRSPPREKVRFYIRTHWWPLLNVFNPRASMLEVTISKDERHYVRGNKLVVEEKPIRQLVDHNRMVTRDGRYDGAPVPVEETKKELESRTSELITRTQKVALSNPHIRKRTLEKSGIAVTPEFVEEVRKAKAEREPEQGKEAAS